MCGLKWSVSYSISPTRCRRCIAVSLAAEAPGVEPLNFAAVPRGAL